MTVFNKYIQVAKKYFKIIIIYTAIFLAMAIFNSTSGSSSETFEAEKVKVAFINNDVVEESYFIKGFKEYIGENATIIALDADEDSLKDALFFRKVDYIIVVEPGFTESFEAGEEVNFNVMSVPDSTSATYSKQLMNTYVNTYRAYQTAGIEEVFIADMVKEDIAQEAPITMLVGDTNQELRSASAFYNFANYTLLAIIVVVTGMIMTSFNEERISRRNSVSSLSYQSINRQLLLGNIVLSMGVWLLYVIASFFIYPNVMFTVHGGLFIINSIVFMTGVMAISFLITKITNSKEIVSGVSNVIGLGTSFISGAFVPQELLGNFVLTIAKFTPSYWYITNNNAIANLVNINTDTLQPIVINMIIVFGFTILFYIAIQVVGKMKLRK